MTIYTFIYAQKIQPVHTHPPFWGLQPAILGFGCRAVHNTLPVASLQLECSQLTTKCEHTQLLWSTALRVATRRLAVQALSLSLGSAACVSLHTGRAESCDELFLCDEPKWQRP